MKNLTQILKVVEKFSVDNSPLILTSIGVAGTISTAILTGRASYQAAEIIREEKLLRGRTDQAAFAPEDVFLTKKETAQLVWKLYIPPVSVAAVTVTSIVMANRIGTRRAAALATAYTALDQTFGEYKAKIVDTIGENKERKARDELAQERVLRNPAGSSQVFIGGPGVVPVYDVFSGRWFESDMQTLKAAQNKINYTINNHMYASVNEFYELVQLPSIQVGEEFGWTSSDQLEIMFSTTMTDDERPALSIEFRTKPVRGYFRAH